jgi:hypothetical protein
MPESLPIIQIVGEFDCPTRILKAMLFRHSIEVYEAHSMERILTLTEQDGDLKKLFDDRDYLKYQVWLKTYANPTIGFIQVRREWQN